LRTAGATAIIRVKRSQQPIIALHALLCKSLYS
jgi:hypothetical protein